MKPTRLANALVSIYGRAIPRRMAAVRFVPCPVCRGVQKQLTVCPACRGSLRVEVFG